MEIDIAPLHNQPLFGSLSISPPASMFESFSPLLHFNDDILDSLNPSTDDDDVDDWLKPLPFDQLFEHDLQLNLNDIDLITEDEKEKFNSNFVFPEDEALLNDYSQSQISQENEFVDLYLSRSSEQQIPSASAAAAAAAATAAAAAAAAATTTMTTTTTTVRLIHQPKLEPTELPTTLYVSGNELQFRPILTATNNHNNGKTIGHTYTTTTSSPITSVPIQSSIPIVPARVLKGKKFKRGGRVTARGASRNSAAAKRRLNSTAAEPKASVVIIAEDATRIDSKTTTLGLSSTSANDNDLLKSTSNNSNRSSTRRRMKSTPREVILFRNGAFISKEPISKQQQQQQQQPTTTLCFETTTTTTNNGCSTVGQPLHQQQITATGLQAAAQIVACNVLRQATFNDALIEQLIKREPSHTDDEYPIYCYSTPSTTSTTSPTMDEYENSCSTTLKILGCNTTAPLTPSNTTTTTTIELLTLAALQQQQQQHQHQQTRQQVCYIKQEPLTTTTTTTFLLPRLLQ